MSNGLKTALLLGALSALFLFLGEVLGGAQGLMIGFIFAVVHQLRLVLVLGQDRPARCTARKQVGPDHPSLRDRRRAGAAGAACRCRRSTSSRSRRRTRSRPAAIPQHAAVAATEGILQILDDEELAGVIAHELAHVKHRDILISSVAATLAATIMMVARFAMFFGGGRATTARGSNPLALLAMMILAPIAAMLIQAAISRSREFDADAGGARIAGEPDGLVNALRKIEAARKRCRWTPTRPRRTCSSSSRSRWRACSRCSAPIRRPSGASRRCCSLGAIVRWRQLAVEVPPNAGLPAATLGASAGPSYLIESLPGSRLGHLAYVLLPSVRRAEDGRARRRSRHLAEQDRAKPRSASSTARSRKRGGASTRC